MKRGDGNKGPAAYTNIDFDQQPFLVIWEATQACDLACVHCRACAQPLRNPLELSASEAKRLIEDVAELQTPLFVISGGDPLKRPDVYELVRHAADLGLRPSMTPSATPLLTREAIVKLKDSGLARLAISLDGPTAEIHDGFRRVQGSFDLTIQGTRWAREIGLSVQINTTITRHNLGYLDDIIAVLEELDIALWSVFFLVPTGRGSDVDLISAEEFEQVFAKLYETSRRVNFDIKSTEAQHYRRYLLQRRTELKREGQTALGQLPPVLGTASADGIGRAPKGINDGKGFAFVSHTGRCFPVASCRFRLETCASTRCKASTAIARFSSPSAIQTISKGNVGVANTNKFVEVPAPEHLHSPTTLLPKSPAACTSQGKVHRAKKVVDPARQPRFPPVALYFIKAPDHDRCPFL